MNWYKKAQKEIDLFDPVEEAKRRKQVYDAVFYEYLGTCISTVDDSCMWDATEMAQLIENSGEFDIYGVYAFLSNELKQKVDNNPSIIECGINNDIVWVYDSIEDIHYFYKKIINNN